MRDLGVSRCAVELVGSVDELEPPAMWLTIDDSAFCEGGVGMLSLVSGVNRREGSGRRAAGVRDLGRKRGSLSPWMVWYS